MAKLNKLVITLLIGVMGFSNLSGTSLAATEYVWKVYGTNSESGYVETSSDGYSDTPYRNNMGSTYTNFIFDQKTGRYTGVGPVGYDLGYYFTDCNVNISGALADCRYKYTPRRSGGGGDYRYWGIPGTIYNQNINDYRGIVTSTNQYAYMQNGWSYVNGEYLWYVAQGANNPPVLSVNNVNKTINLKPGSNTFTLDGTVQDTQNDIVAISATIGGVTKTVNVSGTSSNKTWSLTWNIGELTVGTYTNIPVSATDTKSAPTITNYTGTLIVNKTPLFYWDKYNVYKGYTENTTWKLVGYYPGSTVAYTGYNFNSGTGRFTNSGTTAGVSTTPTFSADGSAILTRYTGLVYTDSNNNLVSGYKMETKISEYTTVKTTLLTANIQDLDGTYPDNGLHTDGYWYVKKSTTNMTPTLTIDQSDMQVNKSGDLTLTGTIYDADGDTIIISATIDGKTKSATYSNTSVSKPWVLQWLNSELPEGFYSNIQVTASDGK